MGNRPTKSHRIMETNNTLFNNAYEGSYYTIIGCGGDLNDWKVGYEELLAKEGVGKPKEWHSFTGADMNDEYSLTGENRYPDDLTFLCFPLDGLDIGKLAMFKLRMGDRWFDDIVNNDSRREAEMLSES